MDLVQRIMGNTLPTKQQIAGHSCCGNKAPKLQDELDMEYYRLKLSTMQRIGSKSNAMKQSAATENQAKSPLISDDEWFVIKSYDELINQEKVKNDSEGEDGLIRNNVTMMGYESMKNKCKFNDPSIGDAEDHCKEEKQGEEDHLVQNNVTLMGHETMK